MSDPFDFSHADREPPCNVEAEAAVLASLLHNNRMIDRCGSLAAEYFIGEGHSLIFNTIKDGIGRGVEVSFVSLKNRVSPDVIKGILAAFISHDIAGYAKEVHDTAMQRALLAITQEVNHAIYDTKTPWADIATSMARQIDRQVMGTMVTRMMPLDAAMDEALAAMERARSGETAGISSGYPPFDERLGGLEPGQVYVIGGRPGMGKSALGHQMAISAARAGHGVLELSLEMSATQLGRRTLSTAAGVSLTRMKSGKISVAEGDRIVRARHELKGLPLTIDDTAGQTPTQIAIKARAARRKNGKLGLVLVDHLNLMMPEEQDARHGGTWATERASATVLQIAKDCECPVILLAQLNRGVENREDKRPTLSDLRQAGAIEQDAYAVGFVYRAEYYLQGEPERKETEDVNKYQERLSSWHTAKERMRGVAEVIWAKVRDGEPGIDALQFDAVTATFTPPQGGVS